MTCRIKQIPYVRLGLLVLRLALIELTCGALTCLAQQVLQSPTPLQPITSPSLQIGNPIPMPVPAQPGEAAPFNRAPTLAEQIVAPPAPIVVQQPLVVIPPGVVYVDPSYPAPGVGWVWGYHPRHGWGWHHPDHGWHRGW
jgi:hypothetical protein